MSLLTTGAIQQSALLLQVVLFLAGLALALAGRFIHDLLIYASGFLGGAWGGLIFLFPLYSGTTFAASQNTLLSGVIGFAIVIISGLIGAALAWQAYVAAIWIVGAVIGFLVSGTALGFAPPEALFHAAASFAVIGGVFVIASLTLLPAVFGVFTIGIAVANLTGRDDILQRIADLMDDSIEDYENGPITSLFIIPIGLMLIAINAGMWLFPSSRDFILTIANGLVHPQLAVIPGLGILAATGVSAVAIWILHRVFLIVETAVIGAMLVSVASVADLFVGAIIQADLEAAIELVDVFSIVFILVCLIGIVIQSGSLFLLQGEA